MQQAEPFWERWLPSGMPGALAEGPLIPSSGEMQQTPKSAGGSPHGEEKGDWTLGAYSCDHDITERKLFHPFLTDERASFTLGPSRLDVGMESWAIYLVTHLCLCYHVQLDALHG